MRNHPLNKKELINEIYDRIAEQLRLESIFGRNELIIESTIHLFMYFHKNNMCKVCYKPNWEKLAQSLEINIEPEFCDNICGYCTQYHVKPLYMYSKHKDSWKKIR